MRYNGPPGRLDRETLFGGRRWETVSSDSVKVTVRDPAARARRPHPSQGNYVALRPRDQRNKFAKLYVRSADLQLMERTEKLKIHLTCTLIASIVAITVICPALAQNDADALSRAIRQQRKGMPLQSVVGLTDYISKNPKDPLGYCSRATIYFENKNYKKAIEDFTTALKLDKKNLTAYRTRGIAYAESGQSNLALADFAEALKLNPKDESTYHERAELHQSLKQYKEAAADWSASIKLDPSESESYYYRAKAYEQLGNKAAAQKDMEKVKSMLKTPVKSSKVIGTEKAVR